MYIRNPNLTPNRALILSRGTIRGRVKILRMTMNYAHTPPIYSTSRGTLYNWVGLVPIANYSPVTVFTNFSLVDSA